MAVDKNRNKQKSSRSSGTKQSVSKKAQKTPSSKFSSFRGWLKRELWKFFVIGFLIVGAYGFYLNAQIKQSFSGNKWQVPAQVYARPLLIKVDDILLPKELLRELSLLKYRKKTQLKGSGDYVHYKTKFHIARRAFAFPEGLEAQRNIEIIIEKKRVRAITDLKTGEKLHQIRLEPLLVTRLMSGSAEDRMLVALEDVPEALVEALLITEDKAFYQHQGVAPLAILRALVANLAAGRSVQGGSTLTQQLVKNLYLTREKSLWRKAKEAYMALLLDAQYSKDEILEAYLNEVFLGQNGKQAVHGFGLASLFYFNRPLQEINLAQVSTLVAMIKGPSRYNPRRYPERVMERRDLILRLLYEHEHINSNQYQYFVQQPLGVVEKSALDKHLHPAFMDQVKRELRRVLPNPRTRNAGIKVFTTLDPHAQKQAERTVEQVLPSLEKARKLQQLDIAMVQTDIRSGGIRALIGSRDVAFAGFNRALDAKRPIGSLVKPAIYLTALEQAEHYNLASPLKDEPIKLKSNYGKFWEPQNADKTFRGEVMLIDALTKSLNVPTVHLGMALGTQKIANTMNKLGVEGDIPLYPAMTLGAVNLSPIQVNQMYQTLANMGRFMPLHSIEGITTHDDRALWHFDFEATQAVQSQAAYLVNYALHKVTKAGTAKALKQHFPNTHFAGKTGTTDDYRDSWFSGFDKDKVATVWIGKDNNEPTQLTGSSGALNYFIQFQKNQDPRSLAQGFPAGLAIAHFDPSSGQVTQAGCQGSISLPAVISALDEPTQACEVHTQKPQKKSFWQRIFGD
ncbi:penicillin-binding protein 1B [Alteromonas sp. a30]|uniref:penicillin-binding protein 1B n=1 Tax=Alteromonas sp. a30 TaxID=2730917 RepID=UPI00227F750F|nr:penicillin-binding protein 1B [Alteromonas sp. a30]MCY7294628.1 penicillin-binding protein 1B [Alteromonas sp. a30]